MQQDRRTPKWSVRVALYTGPEPASGVLMLAALCGMLALRKSGVRGVAEGGSMHQAGTESSAFPWRVRPTVGKRNGRILARRVGALDQTRWYNLSDYEPG